MLADAVAPHVGAWIEISASVPSLEMVSSHPMWVRGLKWLGLSFLRAALGSHPMWVRGLKSNRRHKARGGQSRTPCGCVD